MPQLTLITRISMFEFSTQKRDEFGLMNETPKQKALGDHYRVVIIGAGVGGLYLIKRLTDLGIDVVLLEGEGGVGGTWYRNRYPGARFDSESYTYGFSFSKSLLNEWHWQERYSPQPENLRYFNYVVEKFQLAEHIHFNCWLTHAHWQEAERHWWLALGDGRQLKADFVISAIGLLSVPTKPRYEGVDRFKGDSFHTFEWPDEPVSLEGKRVGVVGTGATGIQVIGEIAPIVDSLHVFQRRPNWAAPLNNSAISGAEMDDIRAKYEEIFEFCSKTPGGFAHEPDRRGFWNFTREERVAFWDELYDQPGFSIWLANFREIFTDERANAEFSDYIAGRIRARVRDPKIAEKLIPKDHGFGWQRVPMETNYYEAFNLPHVHLVDLNETPITKVTESGIEISEGLIALDLIVYATGFDAVTGAFNRIDIRGVGGRSLREKWAEGPETYLGTLVSGFPNFMMVAGPQSASSLSNFPRAIEIGGDWIADLISHVMGTGCSRVEATEEAEAEWTAHVAEMYEALLMRKGKGWFTGYNSNLDGHTGERIHYFVYNGGAPKFHETLRSVASENYRGLTMS